MLHYSSLKKAETYFKAQNQKYNTGTPWGVTAETLKEFECNLDAEIHEAQSSLLRRKEAELLGPVNRAMEVLKNSI